MTAIKTVALVGASGNLGALTLKHLIAVGKFDITLLTRAESTATFPDHPELPVIKGDYSSPEVLLPFFARGGES